MTTAFHHTKFGLTSPVYVNVTGQLNSTSYTEEDLTATQLTSVEIGSNVTSIGNRAFKDCSNLTSVTIPDSVTSINVDVFNGCSNLTSVTIGNNVTSIGDYAFFNCSDLPSVTIPNSVTNIGIKAFSGCSAFTSVTIGNSVINIESEAFAYCSDLSSVTIPVSVTSIGTYAFRDCSVLTSVTIPVFVTIIENGTFSGCSSLTSVTIGNNVTSIGTFSFVGSALTSVIIPDSVTIIKQGAFGNCSALTSVTIPDSVTSIWDSAFGNCSALTSVTIPDSVTSIGTNAFHNCSALTSVIIQDATKISTIYTTSFTNVRGTTGSFTVFSNIADYDSLPSPTWQTIAGYYETAYYSPTIFYHTNTGVTNPVHVNISGDLSSNSYTQEGLTIAQLTSVEIGSNVTSIGNNVFENCVNLPSVTISYSVTSIGTQAFKSCSSLTSVTIPDSVTSIGNNAFDNCSDLTSVIIEDAIKITTINSNSFTDVSGIAGSFIVFSNIADSNLFPSSTASTWQTIAGFYETAHYSPTIFYHTNGDVTKPVYVDISGELTATSYTNAGLSAEELTSVEIGTNVTSIGYQAFDDCSALTSVTIGNNVTSIGNSAFENCSALATLDLSNGIVTIGENAFDSCTSLTEVIIPDSTTSIGEYAFYNCSDLITLYLGNGVETIGDNAFQDCSVLATVTISDVSGITDISSNSFTDLSGTDSYSGSTITFTGYDSFIELDNVWIDNGLQSTWDAITSYFETQNPPKQIDPTLSNFSIPRLNITNTEPYTIIPPDSNSSGTFTYDSSNTNIVEISGNTIISENKTAGKTTITATQEETRYYFTGSISAPVTNICFLAGTPVTTDQGNIPIEKINPKIHTIRNKKIVCITQTITQDKHLICFEKNSLGKNIPSQQTIITRNHRIFYKGKMIKACKFTDIKNVYEIKYNGEFLYNVLMEEHDKMIVNNFICETLDPKNDIAKLYRCFENKTKTQIEQMIQCYNKNVIKKKIFSKR